MQTIVRWMKRIFSLQVFGTVMTLLGLLIAAAQFVREKGGCMTVVCNGETVESGAERNIFVFTEAVERDVGALLPELRFSNPTAYSIRDFALQYDIEAEGVQFRSTDFYRTLTSQGRTTLRYHENMLYAYSSIEPPLVSLAAERPEGLCRLRVRATYDGTRRPFGYTTNIRFRQIARKAGSSFQEWQAACDAAVAQMKRPEFCDILYVGAERQVYAADVRPQSLAAATPTASSSASTVSTASTADRTAAFPNSPAVSKPSEPRKAPKTPETPADSKAEPPAAEPATASAGVTASAPINETRPRVLRADTIRCDNGNLGLRLTFERPRNPQRAFVVYKVIASDGREWLSGDLVEISRATVSHTVSFSTKTRNIVFQQLAQEDSTLRRYVPYRYVAQEGAYRFSNDSPVPIGIAFESSDSGSRKRAGFVLEAGQSMGYKQDSNCCVRFYKLQEVPERTWSLAHIFYDENDDLDWERIGLAVFTLFLLLLPFAFWALSDFSIRTMFQEGSLWDILGMLIVSPIVSIVISIILYYNGYNY